MLVDLVDTINLIDTRAREYAQYYTEHCSRCHSYTFDGWTFDSENAESINIFITLKDPNTDSTEFFHLAIDVALFFKPGGFTQVELILEREDEIRIAKEKAIKKMYAEDKENRRILYEKLKEEFEKGE